MMPVLSWLKLRVSFGRSEDAAVSDEGAERKTNCAALSRFVNHFVVNG